MIAIFGALFGLALHGYIGLTFLFKPEVAIKMMPILLSKDGKPDFKAARMLGAVILGGGIISSVFFYFKLRGA